MQKLLCTREELATKKTDLTRYYAKLMKYFYYLQTGSKGKCILKLSNIRLSYILSIQSRIIIHLGTYISPVAWCY